MKDIFSKDIILENDSVRLRPLHQDDTEHLLSFVEKEPNLWNYSTIPPNTHESMLAYISKALSDRKKQDSYPFIIHDKLTDSIAGSTRFYDYQVKHDSCQLGYTWIGKAYQGTGLNKTCKYLLLEFAFEKAGIHRVEFRADVNNAKSIAAMKSIGCTVEGILRQNYKKLNGRRDSIILSILVNEWHESVKEKLKEKIRKDRPEEYGY